MNKPDWLNIDVSQQELPILMLGRIDEKKNPEAQKAKTTENTQRLLNEIVADFLDSRVDNNFMPYSDTGIVGKDETFVGKLDKIVISMPEVEKDVAADSALLVKHIEYARHTNDQITLEEFEEQAFTFYMIVVKNHAGEDVAFVRRLRGFKLINDRWRYIAVGNSDSLEPYDKPIFKLDLAFDFALRGSDLAVWNLDSFLGLFIDVDALKGAVPTYLSSIRAAIKVRLTDSTVEGITTAAEKSISIAKQVKRISHAPYLDAVTSSSVQDYLEQAKEIADGIQITGDSVDVEESAIPTFLKLVEQRFWRGHFDQNLHEAQAFVSPEAP